MLFKKVVRKKKKKFVKKVVIIGMNRLFNVYYWEVLCMGFFYLLIFLRWKINCFDCFVNCNVVVFYL